MAFGKKNEESIGLLKDIRKDGDNTKTHTIYGFVTMHIIQLIS